MKDFIRSVRKHIEKLDAGHLREQYKLVADEYSRIELLLNVLKDGVLRLDSAGEVLEANPAAKHLLGSSPETALSVLDIPLGKSSKSEIEISYPESRTLELQTIPLGDETIVYLRDITSEKARTEEELRIGATRAIQNLAAGVAHEIGNPLNAISMNLQLIERDPTDAEAIAVCKEQVLRLDGIIREFLAALRPQKPNLTPGSPVEPLTNCLNALKPQFAERKINVTLDVPAALPSVALDKRLLEQVFFNLLKNALEAIKDGGSINIELTSDDRDIQIRLQDSGLGMNDEQLANLFEPYRTTKEKGTGLGLMVSKRIITDHGGTIIAESAVGKGTAFTVRLPRLERRIRVLK